MQDRRREESISRLLSHYTEEAVPDDVDLWPVVAQRLAAHPVRRRSTRRWVPVAAAAAIVLAAFSAWTLRPQPVSAADIVTRAQAAAIAPDKLGVRSFIMRESSTYRTANGGMATIETSRWYEAPNRYRVEVSAPAPGAGDSLTVVASDGSTVWSYSESDHRLTLTDAFSGPATWGLLYVGDAAPSSLSDLLAQMAGPCSSPAVAGTDSVAGRPAYRIEFESGQCPAATAATTSRSLIWVDKQTFFILKSEHYRNGSLTDRREVTAVQYDSPIDGSRFGFAPPPNTMVDDSRSKPSPGLAPYLQQLTALATGADAPLFYPKAMPAGLAPQAPEQTAAGFVLSYRPADPGRTPGFAGTAVTAVPTGTVVTAGPTGTAQGLTLLMRRAARSDMARPSAQAEPLVVGSRIGWYQPDASLADGTTVSDVSLVRDGTWIDLSGLGLSESDLMHVAASLAPVPGGHAPLPSPAAWSIPELKQTLSYALYLPAETADLKHGAPAGGEQPQTPVRLIYSDLFGKGVLTVTNGPSGCCEAAGTGGSGKPVLLPGGQEARLVVANADLTLWWQQNGTYVSLSSSSLTGADLIRLAGTVTRQ